MRMLLSIVVIIAGTMLSSCNSKPVHKSNTINPDNDISNIIIPQKQDVRLVFEPNKSPQKSYIHIELNHSNKTIQTAINGAKFAISVQAFDLHSKLINVQDMIVDQDVVLIKNIHEIGDIGVTNLGNIESGFFVIYVDGVAQKQVVNFYLYDTSNLLKYSMQDVVFSKSESSVNFTVELNKKYTDHDPVDTKYEVSAEFFDYNHKLFASDVVSVKAPITLDKEHYQSNLVFDYKWYDAYVYDYKYHLKAGYFNIFLKRYERNEYFLNFSQDSSVDFYAQCDPDPKYKLLFIEPDLININVGQHGKVRLINCRDELDKFKLNSKYQHLTIQNSQFDLYSTQTTIVDILKTIEGDDCVTNELWEDPKLCYIQVH